MKLSSVKTIAISALANAKNLLRPFPSSRLTAAVIFASALALTAICFICCGIAISRSMTYEADLRNSSASLALMRDAIRSAKMQSEALTASYLSDQKRFQEHLDGLTDQMRDKTLTLEQIRQKSADA